MVSIPSKESMGLHSGRMNLQLVVYSGVTGVRRRVTARKGKWGNSPHLRSTMYVREEVRPSSAPDLETKFKRRNAHLLTKRWTENKLHVPAREV